MIPDSSGRSDVEVASGRTARIPMDGVGLPAQRRGRDALEVGASVASVRVDGGSAMVTPTYGFAIEPVGGLRDPVDLLSHIVSCGATVDQAVVVAQSYYAALTAVSSDTPGSSVGTSSSRGSARRSERTLRWQQEMSTLPDQPGACYLQVVRWGKRRSFLRDLGINPTLRRFIEYSTSGDLDCQLLRRFNVYHIPSHSGLGPGSYHVAQSFGTRCLGTVYDVIASAIQLGTLQTDLAFDTPFSFVQDVCVSASIGAPDVSTCNCLEQLATRPVYVLPSTFVDHGYGWGPSAHHQFITPGDWSAVTVYVPRHAEREVSRVAGVPGTLATVYVCGHRFVLDTDTIFITPPSVKFSVSGTAVSFLTHPCVVPLGPVQIQHWIEHFRTHYGAGSDFVLESDQLRLKSVDSSATRTVGCGTHTVGSQSVLSVRVGDRPVYVTGLHGCVSVGAGSVLLSATQSVLCYPVASVISLVSYSGARVAVSVDPYCGRFWVDAPDLRDLVGLDFTQCRCQIHKPPLTKLASFASSGCSRLLPGAAYAVKAAFDQIQCVCHALEGTRVRDHQLLRLVLSDVDPGALVGRKRTARFKKLCTSSEFTDIRSFGNGYCYLNLLSHDLWWRAARLLGPNPKLSSFARVYLWAGDHQATGWDLVEVRRGFYHVERSSSVVRGLSAEAMYRKMLVINSNDQSVRIGFENSTVEAESLVHQWNHLATPAFVLLVSCVTMLVSILILLIKLVFMRHWYV